MKIATYNPTIIDRIVDDLSPAEIIKLYSTDKEMRSMIGDDEEGFYQKLIKDYGLIDHNIRSNMTAKEKFIFEIAQGDPDSVIRMNINKGNLKAVKKNLAKSGSNCLQFYALYHNVS